MSKQCVKCNSNSTVLDNNQWVCAEHINPCRCTRNHDYVSEWNFGSLTVEAMEAQSPDIHEEEFMKRTKVSVKPLWVNLKQDKTDKQ